ncbi:MAG: isoprenyl transferase [Planctomycetaceae bacterium]|nr:isoprenyl transferase [Planctomycetaceae bacterium]
MEFEIPRERLPRHIAVIMDGNGRWARQRGLPRAEGHRAGATSVRRVTEECARLGIEQLTLYCLSSENWKRPVEELDFLLQLLEHYLVNERAHVLDRNIRVRWIGRREGLPDGALRELDETVRQSAANTGLCVCLAINYGGRAEIVDAVRRVADEVRRGELAPEAVTEPLLSDRLDTAGMPDPDLLIRTAGEMRVSNFLLWQISYAELWVTDVCWPDFDERQLHAALASYAARQRRFGGLNRPEKS